MPSSDIAPDATPHGTPLRTAPRADAGSADTLLGVESLSYRYGERVALDSVSLGLRSGEILGLLGPNGAGKTTLSSCLCGLLRPAQGRLLWRGTPFLPRTRAADRARIGYVPQELALYDDLTARENLALFARLHGVADREPAVERGLALAGLQERADERVRRFSGGMKRRLNIAMAVLHEPELLLLDEPAVGVDPQSRHHLFEAIAALARAGCAVLYTSHSMDEVQRLCARVAIMDQGRLLAAGTPAELAERAGLPDADLERTFLQLTGRRLRDDET
ncbi:MAG: ABC transporter ATP-binding protein [Planctomycetota bacterium]